MRAEITLTSAESKRLIAKGVVQMDAVRKAREKGILVIGRGSTNSYIAEEITGSKIKKGQFTAGYIGPRGLEANPTPAREIILVDGKIKEGAELADAVKDLKPGDVVIKGANAIGPDGIPALLIGRRNRKTTGGVLGMFQMTAMARGIEIIIPVGLEKYIPTSVTVGSKKLSIGEVDYATGMPCGLIPIFGTVVTEVEAFKMLADVEVTPIAAGGIGGAEGSVTFLVEGSEAQVWKVIKVIEGIKGEPPIQEPK
jgi:hypothetical protein